MVSYKTFTSSVEESTELIYTTRSGMFPVLSLLIGVQASVHTLLDLEIIPCSLLKIYQRLVSVILSEAQSTV